MHILYICHEYPPAVAGGIGPAVATIGRGMVQAGHRVSALGFDNAAGVENDQGVRVYRYTRPPARRLLRWWQHRRFLQRQILDLHAREPIDLIEWPDFGGWYWRKIPGVVDVVKVHGTTISHRIHGIQPNRQIATEALELRTLRRIPNWIGVSHWFNAEWRAYANVKPARETVVYNPVDMNLFRPTGEPRDPNLVVYAGGLRRRKGVPVLAAAARVFLARRPATRLVMIGFPDDVSQDDVRGAAGADVASRIEFIPYMKQADLASYFSRASVYAMPSLYESCGNTWIEAAACEAPVVGSTLSCGPEVVEDKKTGLLADPARPEDVAEKVLRLLDDPALGRRLGEAGRARAGRMFSLDVAVAESERFYNLCLAAAGAPAAAATATAR
jgi:glycosyltransferase involved in cell wall biosynthesis